MCPHCRGRSHLHRDHLNQCKHLLFCKGKLVSVEQMGTDCSSTSFFYQHVSKAIMVIFTVFHFFPLANGLSSSPHYKMRPYWLRVKFGSCINTAFQDKQYSPVFMLVSNLQSGQPSLVYSRLMVKGEIKKGKLAARIQTSHSVCVEAPFGSQDLSRGWWWCGARGRQTLASLFFTLIHIKAVGMQHMSQFKEPWDVLSPTDFLDYCFQNPDFCLYSWHMS